MKRHNLAVSLVPALEYSSLADDGIMRAPCSALIGVVACWSACQQQPLVEAFAPAKSARTPSLLAARPPVISNWRFDKRKGTISGIVTKHPTIPDGSPVTTSRVKDPSAVNTNIVVETKSGSKYQLNAPAAGEAQKAAKEKKDIIEKAAAAEKKRLAEEKRAALEEQKRAAAAEKKRLAEEKRATLEEQKRNAALERQKRYAASQAEKKTPSVSTKKVQKSKPSISISLKQPAAPSVSPVELGRRAKSTFSLTGTSVGVNDKYLLAGKPRQSSGRQAKIWTAYLASTEVPGIPQGFEDGDETKVQQLTIKLSPSLERMRLESTNYDKVQSGLFKGRFVDKLEYKTNMESNQRQLDRKNSALVIESGQYDLKALLAARKGAPLRGRALRDAAVSAGQCIQAVHSSGLVWSDLKTENFVVVVDKKNFNKEVDDVKGSSGLGGVKGIDLESVVQKGGNPIDYSPEATPPEFAKAYMEGYGQAFVMDYSYDIWSLGMMLYEISTGVEYFAGQSPSQVTKLLCAEDFSVDVSDVPDAKLRDLIAKCLDLNPKKRPDITGFLLHPYFLTTGIGPISF